MTKHRRLRKPIRMTIKFAGYAVTAAVVDLAVFSTHLYWFGDVNLAPAIGTGLLVNIVLQYLFFKDEMCIEK